MIDVGWPDPFWQCHSPVGGQGPESTAPFHTALLPVEQKRSETREEGIAPRLPAYNLRVSDEFPGLAGSLAPSAEVSEQCTLRATRKFCANPSLYRT